MATRKKTKAKTKVKRRPAPAAKPAARKKAVAPKKKAAPKKRVAPKKTTKRPVRRAPPAKAVPAARPGAARPAAAKLAPAAAPSPATPATPAPASAPAQPEGERIGVVTHYYGHLSVAAVRLETGRLRVGDTIRIRGHTSDFTQRVESLQVEHRAVTEVGPNDDFALKVKEQAREHDVVYKLAP